MALPPKSHSAGGFVKARVKKIMEGTTFDKTFDSSEMVEIAEIEKEKVQYSWEDTHEYVFMDMETYEERRVPKEDVSGAKFMEEGLEVKLQYFDGKVIGKYLISCAAFIFSLFFYLRFPHAFAKRSDWSIIHPAPPTGCYSKHGVVP